MRAFRLNKPMPHLPRDVVFVLDEKNESKLGNPANGALILAWENGNCQGGWCGATFVLPGQCIRDYEFFTEIENPKGEDERWPLRYYVRIETKTTAKVF